MVVDVTFITNIIKHKLYLHCEVETTIVVLLYGHTFQRSIIKTRFLMLHPFQVFHYCLKPYIHKQAQNVNLTFDTFRSNLSFSD